MICDRLSLMIAIDPTIYETVDELLVSVYTQGGPAGQISYAWSQYSGLYDKSIINWRTFHEFNIVKAMKIF